MRTLKIFYLLTLIAAAVVAASGFGSYARADAASVDRVSEERSPRYFTVISDDRGNENLIKTFATIRTDGGAVEFQAWDLFIDKNSETIIPQTDSLFDFK